MVSFHSYVKLPEGKVSENLGFAHVQLTCSAVFGPKLAVVGRHVPWELLAEANETGQVIFPFFLLGGGGGRTVQKISGRYLLQSN